LPSPEEARRYEYSAQERVVVEMNRARHFIGTPARVASMIRNITADTQADEVMVTSTIFGRAERFRCYELLAEEMMAKP
jgi:alkanesulfonate monooxygenase SsuD/methylene tetrahydromethanopterin reductase-like flavin-dependent oxidoreductase (luciferase family)